MPRVLESRPEFLNFIMKQRSLHDPVAFELPPLMAVNKNAKKVEGAAGAAVAEKPVILRKKKTIPYNTYFPEADESSNTFIRVFNVKKFFSESCATARISPEQYLEAQELGLTRRHDESLSAKIIGSLGHYRLKVLRAQEELGLRTTLFSEKEELCQVAILRLRLLQIIERMHGASITELSSALETYRRALNVEISRLTDPMLPGAAADPAKIVKADLDQAAKLSSQKALLLADIAQVDNFIGSLGDDKGRDARGTDATRDCVAQFVKERVNHILATTRDANEILTLAGSDAGFSDKVGAFFRGSLHVALSEAFQINRAFIWDQHRAILPAHQGDYRGGAKFLTIHSTQLLGKGKNALKDFLFGMNLIVLNPDYAFFAPKAPSGVKIHSNRSHLSWIFRLFTSSRRANEVNQYRLMVAGTFEATRNLFINILDDSISAFQTFGSWVVRTLEVSILNIVALFQGVVSDFWWIPKPVVKAVEAKVGELPIQPHEEVAKDQLELFAWRRMTMLQQISITLSEKLEISHAEHSTEDEAAYLKNIRELINQMAANSPIAQAPYHLRPYSPADALSQLMGGIEGFYSFFASYYETCPSIALYASAVYLLSAAAIMNPALMGQISKSLEFINTWSTVTAEAMSKAEYSQMVAGGFSGFKETLLALQLASDGVDSTLSHAIEYLQSHLPQVIIGGAALAAAGYELSVLGDKVPLVGNEGGNVPGLTQAFVAAKVGVVAYESLHSEFGEQSLAARSLTAILFVPFLALRICLIPFNLLHKGIAELFLRGVNDPSYTPPTLKKVFNPLLGDLPKGIVSVSLRLADLSLRLLNLLAMGFKVVPKLFTDWFVNNLATVANHFQLAVGFVVGVALATFLLPYLGVAALGIIPTVAIGLGVALVTQVLFSLIGINIKLPMISELLLRGKHAVFSFFDARVTRPMKQFYESRRNEIARVLTGVWMTGKEDIATYLMPDNESDFGSEAEATPVADLGGSTREGLDLDGSSHRGFEAGSELELEVDGSSRAGFGFRPGDARASAADVRASAAVPPYAARTSATAAHHAAARTSAVAPHAAARTSAVAPHAGAPLPSSPLMMVTNPGYNRGDARLSRVSSLAGTGGAASHPTDDARVAQRTAALRAMVLPGSAAAVVTNALRAASRASLVKTGVRPTPVGSSSGSAPSPSGAPMSFGFAPSPESSPAVRAAARDLRLVGNPAATVSSELTEAAAADVAAHPSHPGAAPAVTVLNPLMAMGGAKV